MISYNDRPSRRGKCKVSGYYHPAIGRTLKVLAAERSVTIQVLLAEAIENIFALHLATWGKYHRADLYGYGDLALHRGSLGEDRPACRSPLQMGCSSPRW
jgi:hypothetical protein